MRCWNGSVSLSALKNRSKTVVISMSRVYDISTVLLHSRYCTGMWGNKSYVTELLGCVGSSCLTVNEECGADFIFLRLVAGW